MTAPRSLRPALARVLAVLVTCAASSVLVPAADAMVPPSSGCAVWHKSTVAKGFKTLENLGFDGQGGMLLSETSLLGGGSLRRLAADGTRGVVVPKVDGPGGIVVDGTTVYFTTGNTIASGILGRRDGTVRAVDLTSGAVTTIATGLVMPNGMTRLHGGDLLVSRDVGSTTAMTRVRLDGTTSTFAPGARSTNGMAVDQARGRLYVASTFEATSAVNVVDLADPAAAPRRTASCCQASGPSTPQTT